MTMRRWSKSPMSQGSAPAVTDRFDRFVLLAEMRTGSNFLEESLNQIDGLRCWGEAFNPHFTGNAGKTELAGLTILQRDRDPLRLLKAMDRQTDGLAGFRFFHDHDRRVLDRVLPDPRCAKIVLTRNPLDSYVSLKIARTTNQWRLDDMTSAKTARIAFDAAEFRGHLAALGAFQVEVLRALQTSGQTAFYIAYEDVGEIDVLNGLAAWLGVRGRLDRVAQTTRVQNPSDLRDKVENYDEMIRSLGSVDHFGLGRTPNFEPRRGPQVPSFVTARTAPLLFMPVAGAPSGAVESWLARLDGAEVADLGRPTSQKDIRRWKRERDRTRAFTMLRHPVARLHDTFCRRVLMPGPDCFAEIRDTLRGHYKLPIPEGAPGMGYNAAAHRAAFLAFARFVAGNLGGQTAIRVDPSWASQSSLLQGMAQFMLPDLILREDEAALHLQELATRIGLDAPAWEEEPAPPPLPLSAIYDREIEETVRAIYRRDYIMLGFAAWR